MKKHEGTDVGATLVVARVWGGTQTPEGTEPLHPSCCFVPSCNGTAVPSTGDHKGRPYESPLDKEDFLSKGVVCFPAST